MAFLDDLRKNLSALSKASEEVVRKSGGAVELRKLKMEQESLKSELNNCYAQIGRLVVEKMDDVDVSAEMEMLVRQIADCKEAIAENEQLIAQKKGLRICPVCGAKAGKGALFCQKCGTRLPDYSEPEDPFEDEEPSAEEAEPADAFAEDLSEKAEDIAEKTEDLAEKTEDAAEEAAEAAEEMADQAEKAAEEAAEAAEDAPV